ncbi:hypothetical protein LA080_003066 [Diaporthe eres]|nr:hypothetical protein LA080_003066 [Diaporthe eres]
MADMLGNETLVPASSAADHRTYSDDGLSWPNRKSDFVGTLVSLLVLAWAAVALRLYTRFRIVRAPGWDDLLIGIALVTGSISGISLGIATNYGMGHHIYEIPRGDLENVLLLFYLSNAGFTTSNALSDLKITSVAPAYQYYRYGSTDETQVYGAVISANIINMVLDIMIFILPIPLLFRNDTARNTKIGLLASFGLGIIINIIAGLRLASTEVIKRQGLNEDLTFNFPRIFVLGEAENRLSTILASIPVFWPIVTQKVHQIFITREFRVESTYQISSEPPRHWKDDEGRPDRYKGRQGNGDDIEMQTPQFGAFGKGGMEYQEDEVLEAGVRHPGRRIDVESYTRALVGPFAETEDAKPPVIYEVRAESASRK